MEALGVSEFWRGRRVLLTGHTGFKGAWLALWLSQMGARVTGFALPPPSDPSLHALASASVFEHDIIGDLRDPAAVDAAYARAAPEVVLHLAAQALVRPSFADPVATYATNVMGTVHVLDAARRQGGVAAVVVVTSDKAYENREWHWAYREDEAMGGHDPYSSSKGCAELVTAAFRRSYFAADPDGAAVASARAGNVIGGGDWALDRVVPDCIRAFADGRKVALRSPGATRPWQHVLEPLAGYLALAERLATGVDRARFAAGWNFGPAEADAIAVGELVTTLARFWGDDAGWELDARPQPHEAHYLKVDASKARAELGWRPALGVTEALDWTVDWYRRQARGEDARELCLDQIARYRARMADADQGLIERA
ncbi:CDP-glucose 4,6-dehydratase [Roseomonas arctica]|uniref:CDP-glucose 4,6-dehydratase n=1 Tax=Plastoroseomonas arctica TaxID=1509237 RepID=A0AAF1JWW6_9PROT|nr:CDP-glucose 4,6-dehydratase [Plastoroseomonas arctica]